MKCNILFGILQWRLCSRDCVTSV